MKKALLIVFVLILAIIAVASLYFSNLSSDTKKNNQALSFIPSTALVVSFRYDESYRDIFKEYQLFNSVIGEKEALRASYLQKSVLQNAELKEATEGKTVFISFHPETTSINLLWLTATNNQLNKEDFHTALTRLTPDITLREEVTAGDQSYYSLFSKTLNEYFYLHFSNGIVLCTFSKDLIVKSLDRQAAKIDEQFISEINAGGQKNLNSPFNLFINHNTFPKFTSSFFDKNASTILSLLNQVEGFSTFNMNYKSDAIMFNGLSSSDTTVKNYFNLFLNQKPVVNNLKRVFPSNVANYLSFGISSYPQFGADLRSLLARRGELKPLEGQISRIFTESGINLERDIKVLWGSEFGLCQYKTKEKLAVIQLTNGSKFTFFSEPISKPVQEPVRQFNNSQILYYYFGEPMKEFKRPFFAVVDNYLVVANTVYTIQQFLNSYTNQKTLVADPAFSDFSQLVANQSNISYYLNINSSHKILQSLLRRPFAKALTDSTFGYPNLYGLAYQMSSEGDHFFSNIYINKIKGSEQRDSLMAE